MLEKEKIAQNVQKLSINLNSTQMLRAAFELIEIKRENIKRKVIFLVPISIVCLMLAMSKETINQTESILEMINTVILSLFAVVFTGYALFQALMGDKLLLLLLMIESTNDNDASSKLEETNKYFVKVMLLQFFLVMVNLSVTIFLKLIPTDWTLFDSITWNERICFVMLLALLYINMDVIWETKSFIFNVFQLFNLHAFSRTADILEKESNDKAED